MEIDPNYGDATVATDSDMALCGISGWDLTTAPGGSAGHSQQSTSHHPQVSNSTSLLKVQAALLLFLSHLTTHHLPIRPLWWFPRQAGHTAGRPLSDILRQTGVYGLPAP